MPGAVRNADRKCKAKTNLVSACGKPNLGEYTAKPHLPGLGKIRITDLNTETSSNPASEGGVVVSQSVNIFSGFTIKSAKSGQSAIQTINTTHCRVNSACA